VANTHASSKVLQQVKDNAVVIINELKDICTTFLSSERPNDKTDSNKIEGDSIHEYNDHNHTNSKNRVNFSTTVLVLKRYSNLLFAVSGEEFHGEHLKKCFYLHMTKFGEIVQNNRFKYIDDSNEAVDYGHYLFKLSLKNNDSMKLQDSGKRCIYICMYLYTTYLHTYINIFDNNFYTYLCVHL
jgi:hypothetical protein